ncbi:MAG: hypothetical protein ACREMB_26175 [Candidatus Rokuibacteriota bacterium]
MSEPILFVLEDDPETLAALAGALERRFGDDYRVLTDQSPTGALARLRQARDRGEELASVLADQWMPDMTGIDGSCARTTSAPGPGVASWWPTATRRRPPSCAGP